MASSSSSSSSSAAAAAPAPSPSSRGSARRLNLEEVVGKGGAGVRTVESHRAHVMTKLRAGSRAAMVRHALEAGLLDDEREHIS